MKTITVKSHAELDALVAQKVMGWKKIKRKYAGELNVLCLEKLNEDGCRDCVPLWAWRLEYSSDIAAAFQVVEKTEADVTLIKRNGCYICEMTIPSSEFQGVAIAAPLAICFCALASVGIEAQLEIAP